ncbi:hypothetical protein AMC83_CH01076 [Rhizobium phaseoli]|uniref:hypothetical protein n=1 Tax=Rhizobium phaseoli TaxID=396 RepID=UPI0007EA9289|nr:hypothetical protein [Rhizobium phaseoli]ANL71100.1 hypothetical protein AMC83_CH01076 [Rhizobium phaseoli]
MKVLGFRGDPNAPRYAVVSEVGGAYSFENASSDNKLSVPASIGEDADDERLDWLYREATAIFDAHPGIERVVIKQNEYTQSDTKAKRKSAHADAAVVLACAHRGIPVDMKIYASMQTTSKQTKQHAESRVGKADKYWDSKMADAVNAAWWGLRNI